MKNFLYRIPFPVRLHLIFIGILLLILTLYRLGFLSVYAYRLHDTGIGRVLLAFLVGLRFDLAASYLLLGPFLLLSLTHYPNRLRIFQVLWRYGPVAVILFVSALCFVDIIYFENANKHLGYEAFAYLNRDLFVMVGAAFARTPLQVVAALGGIALIFAAAQRVLRRFPYEPPRRNIVPVLIWFVAGVAWMLFFARGGPQSSPIRSADAVISKNVFVNNLGLNPAFTAIADLKVTGVSKRHRLDRKTSIRAVRESIAYKGADFISDEYPILRRVQGAPAGRPPNVVLVILEGWTGRFINPITDGRVEGKEIAPHFNRLLQEGLFFRRCIAAGGRTTNGLMSIVGGIPDRPGLTVVRTREILSRFSGLGNVLKEQLGYQSLFVSGTNLSFNNKGTIMSHWGFDRRLGKAHIASLGKYKIGAWGYDDGDILELFHDELMKMHAKGKPFVGAIHTATTHYPYRVPEKRFERFGPKTRDHEYLNVYGYADWALHQFVEKARRSPYFKNTIFVFASDHTHHRYLNYYEDRNVPLLFYAPGRIRPETRDDIVSQLDILPTVLGMLGREVYFSGMGSDLMKSRHDSAYFAYGNLFGWVNRKLFYYQTVEGGIGESYQIAPPWINLGICYAKPRECDEHYLRARGFLNLSFTLLNENKIFPSRRALEKIRSSRK